MTQLDSFASVSSLTLKSGSKLVVNGTLKLVYKVSHITLVCLVLILLRFIGYYLLWCQLLQRPWGLCGRGSLPV